MFGNLGGTLPIAASTYAEKWDQLYAFLFILCVVFFVIVLVPMIYFCIRYRARPGVKPDRTFTHSPVLEFIWTVIPTAIVLVVFVWGWIVYKDLVEIPPNAMTVRVVAKSWTWTFQYEDGRITTNEMYVPAGQPVKLLITSEPNDVLHSFYVPNFRMKRDAVPGMFSTLWFQTDKVGQHIIFCAEYCGAGHSNMMGRVIVLPPDDYQKWKWGSEIVPPPVVGLAMPSPDAK